MKRIFILISLVIICFSCSTVANKPDLYITKSTVNSDSEGVTKETYVYDETYIELNVVESTLGGFQASYKLPKKDNEDGSYTVGALIVTDKEGVTITYDTPIDFLNYIDSLGFEITSEKVSKYGSKIYTFKRN